MVLLLTYNIKFVILNAVQLPVSLPSFRLSPFSPTHHSPGPPNCEIPPYFRIAAKFEFCRTLPPIGVRPMAAATLEELVLTHQLALVPAPPTSEAHCVLSVGHPF